MKTRYNYSPLKRFKDWLTGPFHSASTRLVRHLRSRGVKVGDGVVFRDAKSVTIDLTRPSLIEIGDNVDINVNFTIMTHDFASGVFLNKYNELINSSGRVKLGNNIYIGRDVTILKGVSIGDNCVIGLGSIVTSDIPSDSVAVGSPERLICTIDEYFSRRKGRCLEEAFEYARSIRQNFGREPQVEDFWEEFPHFVSGDKIDCYPTLPIKRQLGQAYNHYRKHHKATFDSFEEFLTAALSSEASKASDK
jgi:serine acetyltransferase